MAIPRLQPMLAVRSQPFDSDEFEFEIKWDGYRALAYLGWGEPLLISRNGHQLGGMFPEILASLRRQLPVEQLILDGELVILDDEGKADFAALQKRTGWQFKETRRRGPEPPGKMATFMAFDLLWQGNCLCEKPLYERRQRLSTFLASGILQPEIALSRGIRGKGRAFFELAVEQGIEGVVGKRLDSRYLPGQRSPAWKKVTRRQTTDCVVIGYRRRGRYLKSLVLGQFLNGRLIEVGSVGSGFSDREGNAILAFLEQIRSQDAPIVGTEMSEEDVVWVRPFLVVEISYLTRTADGRLRHPVLAGFRTDKDPGECYLERSENDGTISDR